MDSNRVYAFYAYLPIVLLHGLSCLPQTGIAIYLTIAIIYVLLYDLSLTIFIPNPYVFILWLTVFLIPPTLSRDGESWLPKLTIVYVL